jgi:MFS family permease
VVLALLVPDSRNPRPRAAAGVLDRAMLRRFRPSFWGVVALAAVLTLARFSQAFLILRGRSLGLDPAHVPLLLAGMNLVYAVTAYPAGWLSDRVRRSRILAAGTLALLGADLALARATGGFGLALGVALWGLHMGLSEGLLSALVADAAPAEARGTAFGVYALSSGVVLLASSVVAGGLWDRFGAPATFYAGAAVALVGFLGLAIYIGRTRRGARA